MPGPRLHCRPLILTLCTATILAAAACQPARAGIGQDTVSELRAARIRGLDWLVAHQEAEGYWQAQLGKKSGTEYLRREVTPHVGVTALAGLALLTSPERAQDHAHRRAARAAADWIGRQASDFGYLSAHGSGMYSHGFATLFLARIQALEPEETRANTLELAVALTCSSANEEGAWAYAPFARSVDLSVTVCQLQALRAARACNTHVPEQAIQKALTYIGNCRVSSALDAGPPYHKRDDYHKPARIGHFRYDSLLDERTSFGLNAAAVAALGVKGGIDSDLLRQGVAFLLDQQEDLAKEWQDHFFFYYGHYYAAEALAQLAKEHPDRQALWLRYWNPASQTLLQGQRDEGNWHLLHGPGPGFATAMACLILAHGE